MVRKLFMVGLALLLITAGVVMLLAPKAYGATYTQKQLAFVDEDGRLLTHTTLTSVTIKDAGTATNSTIYSDRIGTAKTNPITTGLAADQITFWSRDADYKCTATDGTYSHTRDNLTGSNTRFTFPTYLVAMSARTASDSQTYAWGTETDVTSQWINGTSIFRWSPDADGVSYDIGSTLVAKQFDFHVYVGGVSGGGLTIDEDTGAFTYVSSSGAIAFDATGSGAFGVHTGAATGAITLGSGTSGAIALDTTAGITVNADDSYALTVEAGTIGIASTGGDTTIDATDKSVIIRGTEAATDAILLDADAGAGGITLQCGTGDITLDSGDDIFLAADTGSGDVISILNVQGTNAAAILIETTGAGSMDINSGDNITIDAADDFTLTTAGGAIGLGATGGDITIDGVDSSVIIRGTEAVSDAILLDADAGSIDIDSADNITIDVADDITIDTAEGKIHLIADGTTAGDITLDSEDDLIFISTGKVTITNTEAVTISGDLDVDGVITTDGLNTSVIEVGDSTAYDVLAANTGMVHVIPDLTGDLTMDLPTEAAGLYYKFIYVGGAEDAQDWTIDSENNTNFFTGGLMTIDDDDHSTLPVYSDNTDDSICKIDTPGTGTVVEIWCDGTIWFMSGTVVSGTDTAVAFSNL